MEIRALAAVFDEGRLGPLSLARVKSNIGILKPRQG